MGRAPALTWRDVGRQGMSERDIQEEGRPLGLGTCWTAYTGVYIPKRNAPGKLAAAAAAVPLPALDEYECADQRSCNRDHCRPGK